jgi:hypothetical protein
LWLKPASQQRTSAPVATLAAISSRLVASSAPKMTPSEAAPTAANKVKRGVEAGGNRPAESSADCAASIANVPWQTWLITVVTASTLPMSTPSGLAGTICETGASSSSTVISPQ